MDSRQLWQAESWTDAVKHLTILVDVRGQAGMTQEIAERGVRRAYGADKKAGAKIQSIRVIGDGFDFTVHRVP
jgi:hypothetical protein